jgi:RNA polymerase sigma factor (sigma-70 family)
MSDTSDAELLEQFARNKSETAFAELVERHIGLVYSTAFRKTGNPQQSEDITQAVFIILARKANSLGPETVLPGWLHHTARLTAANFQRAELRRIRREREAFMQSTMNETAPDPLWRELSPLLDDAVAALRAGDRDAIVLRFFQNRSLAETGATLGASEDATRMRVNRALEKMRKFFVRRGVTISSTAIAGTISANSLHAAPPGLAAIISANVFSGTTVTTTAVVAATKAIAMTTFQKAIVTAALVATVGAGVFEAHQNSQSQKQIENLQQQQNSLNEQLAQSQRERDDATNRLAGMLAQNVTPHENELLKLRGETGMLREQNEKLVQALQSAEKQNHPAFPTNLISRANWGFAGYDTPEHALASALWAKSVGNERVYLNTLSPQMTNGAVQGTTDEERSQFLISQTKDMTGYRILSEIPVADDEVILQAEANGPVNGQSNIVVIAVLKYMDGGWKEFDEYQGVGDWPENSSNSGRTIGK